MPPREIFFFLFFILFPNQFGKFRKIPQKKNNNLNSPTWLLTVSQERTLVLETIFDRKNFHYYTFFFLIPKNTKTKFEIHGRYLFNIIEFPHFFNIENKKVDGNVTL